MSKTDPDQKPIALKVCPERIPGRLKEGFCFVVWRWEWKVDRWDKPPRQPNGSLARVDDPETWVTFDAAMEAYLAGRFDGVGRVMVKADGLVGIDRDACVDYATKRIDPHARAVVDLVDSYTELSPSGSGLRTFALGELPAAGRKKGDVELYDSDRYLTLTGHRVHGQWRDEPLPSAVMERREQILELHRRIFGASSDGAASERPQLPARSLTAYEIVKLAEQHGSADKWARLLRGDLSEYNGDDSRADSALCALAAFYTDDLAVIDQIVRMSGLCRPKWTERQDYRARTIRNALQLVEERYSAPSQSGIRHGATTAARGDVGTPAAEYRPRGVRWLWKPWLPEGQLVGLDGDPGEAKSQLLAFQAAHITRGTAWPDGSPCPQGGVIIVGGEDSIEATWVPRLIAAGADLARVLLIAQVPTGEGLRLIKLPDDVPLLALQVKRWQARLIAFDPIMPYITTALDTHRDQGVRQALTPLAEMLARTRCTGELLRHFNKDDRVSNALYRGSGSIAFSAMARVAMVVAKDKDSGDRLLMMPKNNLAEKARSRRYRVEAVDLGLDDDGVPIETSRVVFGEESDQVADDLITAFGRLEKRAETAETFLLRVLAGGPVESELVIEQGRDAGISRSTLFRTKKAMGVRAKKSGFGETGEWTWELPLRVSTPKSVKDSETAAVSNTNSPKGTNSLFDTLRTLSPSPVAKSVSGGPQTLSAPAGRKRCPDGHVCGLAPTGSPDCCGHPAEVVA